MDDLETLDFNNDTEMSDSIDLKEGDIEFVEHVPLHPRERLKRKRKVELYNYSELSKKSKNDITFVKEVPVHSRDRLKKIAAINEKTKFIKQVPVHPQDIEEALLHPRDKLKKQPINSSFREIE